jgi:hypothetical protein
MLMTVSDPYIPHRLLRALSRTERKLAIESNSDLVKLDIYVRGFDYAVRLVDHCYTMRADLHQKKSMLISSDPEGRAEILDQVNMVLSWAVAAARDAAFNAWHFNLVLTQIEDITANRLPLFAAFDHDMLSKARAKFDRDFPSVDRMRRAIVRETKLPTFENAMSNTLRGRMPLWGKKEKGRLLYVVTTFEDRQLQMIHEGELLTLDITSAKFYELVEIKRLIYTSFLPVMAAALDLMKKQIAKDLTPGAARSGPYSLR